MSLIEIDGAALPEGLTTYRVTLSDADGPNSGRAENAVMTRDRVRANIAKIELGWTNMTTAQVTDIIDRVTPEEFSVKYFFGTVKTAKMYAGDKSIDLKLLEESGEARWDISVNLTEY